MESIQIYDFPRITEKKLVLEINRTHRKTSQQSEITAAKVDYTKVAYRIHIAGYLPGPMNPRSRGTYPHIFLGIRIYTVDRNLTTNG